MKKIHIMFFILILDFSVNAQIINIPDVNFKSKLIEADASNGIADDINGIHIIVDINNDNEIQVSEALTVYSLHLSSRTITNLTGIESFTNLQFIECQNNQITNLPFSTLANLEGIICSNNQISSLNEIENLTHLKELWFSFNQITNVNFQNLSQLEEIQCKNNLLTEINLCGTNVRFLWCSNNPNLQALYLKNNVISEVIATAKLTPPPLHNFMFNNLPSLTTICYDSGELDAVNDGLNFNTNGINFTTSCDTNCLLNTDDIDFNTSFTLYPNPAKNTLTINIKDAISVKSINVYNNLGQYIQTVANPNFDSSFILDVSKLQSGCYFMTIIHDKGIATTKFIKN
ncbi:leucine-rich repeat domain-containing protein [Flavobacterium sp. GT3R68]|uniref:leucine-rich repeat domain-containing protein n=1 Tax=Flavobacterium sp. GT3R68 TaxID=2594437 RepID=UPI000F86EDF4|nr:T9SS type A sorting domain-containing protein [Flavobacterium sp. GT3R68]RTY87979.1 T9SS type A sorting domain-containing protein [Flavobacterium sp. GSN2]TRW91138.1 T9SS type A sorting domain-containing protein [Flavobacterium sp. GT3R68]